MIRTVMNQVLQRTRALMSGFFHGSAEQPSGGMNAMGFRGASRCRADFLER